MNTQRHNLYRVLTSAGELHRAEDGRTRFTYGAACSIAARISGRVIK